MGKDDRQQQLMRTALELSRDNPGAARDWYTRLSKGERALLDAGLKELTSVLRTIQSCVNAPKLVIDEALAVLHA